MNQKKVKAIIDISESYAFEALQAFGVKKYNHKTAAKEVLARCIYDAKFLHFIDNFLFSARA